MKVFVTFFIFAIFTLQAHDEISKIKKGYLKDIGTSTTKVTYRKGKYKGTQQSKIGTRNTKKKLKPEVAQKLFSSIRAEYEEQRSYLMGKIKNGYRGVDGSRVVSATYSPEEGYNCCEVFLNEEGILEVENFFDSKVAKETYIDFEDRYRKSIVQMKNGYQCRGFPVVAAVYKKKFYKCSESTINSENVLELKTFDSNVSREKFFELKKHFEHRQKGN